MKIVVLDGYTENPGDLSWAGFEALGSLTVYDRTPFVEGNASGLAVGLPDGQMGNSEVGHLNMGAGRIVYQELTKITKRMGIFLKMLSF